MVAKLLAWCQSVYITPHTADFDRARTDTVQTPNWLLMKQIGP